MLRHRFWNFILSRMARAHGFLDPAALFSSLQRFSKPSEVWVPTELLRSGAVLQARGLLNSQAIQHNRDWIWPYWVQRQFDPLDNSFIPRAFNISHINLTHRNWTALGVPDADSLPIIDPRGLLTPHTDGWSVEGWLLREDGEHVIPSLAREADQRLLFEDGVRVITRCGTAQTGLISSSHVVCEDKGPVCVLRFEAYSDAKSRFAVALRPYNPEGVSFIHRARLLPDNRGWSVNGRDAVHFSPAAPHALFSNYSEGDVFSKIRDHAHDKRESECRVGMVSAALLYPVEPGRKLEVELRIPLNQKKAHSSCAHWGGALDSAARLEIPDEKFRFLYDAALRTLVLHSPGVEIYPGPYTYKRFWFRDAAFILDALMCANLRERAERVLDHFPARQAPNGHFLSQDGEWDSNGQALWILDRFCRYSGKKPKPEWRGAILRGAHWISRKRDRRHADPLHAGLIPAGFSAEHLGPNDYYYWDDFWSIAGLRAASGLMTSYGVPQKALEFEREAADLSDCVERSLADAQRRLGHKAVPASPTRRMDAGAIGSIASGYPLQLWPAGDERLAATTRYLIESCFVKGAFYQEISHSGFNAYLTLHVAQVMLRAGDPCFIDLVRRVAEMASPTGQWPEAVHPGTGGGCMGDGQHVWAAAEWVLMMRNLFVREEGEDTLVLCSGIPETWLKKGTTLSFGPAPTAFGDVNVTVECGDKPRVSWDARWHGPTPKIEIRLPQGTRAL